MSDPVSRRATLQLLAQAARVFFFLPLGQIFHSAHNRPIVQAATGRPKGEEMNETSSALDPYRLPRHVIPTRYDLRLEPDLASATFAGQETVALTIRERTTDIVLNAVELNIVSATVEGPSGTVQDATIVLDEAAERCRLTLGTPLMPGTYELHMTFAGKLNDKLRGFYRSTYKDQKGTTHTIAATQFEATDARRTFPCWDEPDFKAVFATTLVIDPALTAVSNTAVRSEAIEAGKKVVRFADTITMSTYLAAFIVGRLDTTEPTRVGHTPIRLWAIPGKAPLARFGQEIAAASLSFFERYYGIPYPGDKLDLLAIPDFASGAMENLGAITFRETALLVDQQSATHGELERVADVVAHENAHMWFGDLVTMSWWNGLWLNEAFATFMEMLAVDAWKPEWKRWDTFGISRAAALSVDGLHNSRPIEYPVRAPKDADAMFDVLTYEKGASVLRMLEQHIGPTVFRDGVRDYLKTHAYGNADTKDLWLSLGKAARQPVPELMDGWIFQPGYPLITASLSSSNELVLTQQRFTYLPVSSGETDESRWHTPITLRLTTPSGTEAKRLLLTERETRLAMAADLQQVLVNEGAHGFYRVRYIPELLDRLIRQGLQQLATVERFNLLNDAWATTLAGLMPLTAYLDLTAHFTDDRDKNVWAVLLSSFSFLNHILDPAERPGLEALVRQRVRPAAVDVGWTPRPGESELTGQLRSELIGALGKLGNDPATQEQAAERYAAAKTDPTAVDPNLMPAIVSILAHTGDAARYDEFAERLRTATTPQEERRYLFSLAGFQQKPLLERTLAQTLTGAIRTQDAPFLVSAIMGNIYGRELAWTFAKINWETMDRLFPKQGLRRMCGGIVNLATLELERDVRHFFESKKIDLGGKTLAQYLEQLRIAVTVRERDSQSLRTYLGRFGRLAHQDR